MTRVLVLKTVDSRLQRWSILVGISTTDFSGWLSLFPTGFQDHFLHSLCLPWGTPWVTCFWQLHPVHSVTCTEANWAGALLSAAPLLNLCGHPEATCLNMQRNSQEKGRRSGTFLLMGQRPDNPLWLSTLCFTERPLSTTEQGLSSDWRDSASSQWLTQNSSA